eukprot:gene25293-33822_t
MSQGESSTLMFDQLVKSAILSFPDDAHKVLLAYFNNHRRGLTERHSLLFKKSWSKCILANEAFGRKSANLHRVYNPDLFCQELTRELVFGDKDVAQLMNYEHSLKEGTLNIKTMKLNNISSENEHSMEGRIDLAEQIKNGKDLLRELDALNVMAQNLTQLLVDLNALSLPKSGPVSRSSAVLFEDVPSLESINALKNELKGSKHHWSERIRLGSLREYTPLDSQYHGYSGISKGKLSFEEKKQDQSLPYTLSGNDILALSFEDNQLNYLHQERAWASFQCLNELLYCDIMTIFPIPLSSGRGKAEGSLSMTFESPTAKPLGQILGIRLAKYLRLNPRVISIWLSQLSIAMYALSQCSGSLARKIIDHIHTDMYVREDGRLLLGNLAFNCAQPASPEATTTDFLHFICYFLSVVLCISRKEKLALHMATNSSEIVREDEQHRTGKDDQSQQKETKVFYIVEGCTLSIVLSGCAATEFTYYDMETTTDDYERDNYKGDVDVLSVHIEGNLTGVIAADNEKDKFKSIPLYEYKRNEMQEKPQLNIHAMKAGQVRVRLSTHVPVVNNQEVVQTNNLSDYAMRHTDMMENFIQPSSSSSSSSSHPSIGSKQVFLRQKSNSFVVCVLPKMYPVNSVELEELSICMQEYHRVGGNDAAARRTLLKAQMFSSHESERWSRETCSRKFGVPLQELAREWRVIQQEIVQANSSFRETSDTFDKSELFAPTNSFVTSKT